MDENDKRRKNLRPLGNGERTPEQERAIRQAGAYAANEARAKRRSLREALDILLERDDVDEEGISLTGVERVAVGLYKKAKSGDTAAVRLLAEIVGEAQAQGITIAPQIVVPDKETAADVTRVMTED